MLNGTVVNVALPAIGNALDASTSGLQWVLNGYLLAVAALILTGGVMGDRYGRRRMFLWGTGGFAVATVICGISPTIEMLIAGRTLQGVASAVMTPGSLAIIESSFRRQDRGKAIGIWSALGGISAAIGPVLGGWLIDVGSWRWIFFVSLPLAVAVILVAVRFVPESRDEEAADLDWTGAFVLFVALLCLTSALIFAPDRGLTDLLIVSLAVAGVVLLGLFLRWQVVCPHPMMPLTIFGKNQFTAANLVTFVIYSALGAVFFFLVVHLQVTLGYKAMTAGLALLPVTGLMLLLSPRAGEYAERNGARNPLTVGGVLLAAAMAMMSLIGPESSYVAVVLPAVTVFGLGLAATVAPVTSAVLAAADDRHSGLASGVNNAVTRTAQLIAVAIVPWIAGLSGDEIRESAAMAAGFPRAMLVMAAVAATGALTAWLTISSRPLGELSDGTA